MVVELQQDRPHGPGPGGPRTGVIVFRVVASVAAVLSLWSLIGIPIMFIFDDDGTPIPQLMGMALLCLAPPVLFGAAAIGGWAVRGRGGRLHAPAAAFLAALAFEGVLISPLLMNWVAPQPKVMTLFANGMPCLKVSELNGRRTIQTFPGNPCPGKFDTTTPWGAGRARDASHPSAGGT